MTVIELLKAVSMMTEQQLNQEIVIKDPISGDECSTGRISNIRASLNRVTVESSMKITKAHRKHVKKTTAKGKTTYQQSQILLKTINQNLMPIRDIKDFEASTLDALRYLKATPGYDEVFKGVSMDSLDINWLYEQYKR